MKKVLLLFAGTVFIYSSSFSQLKNLSLQTSGDSLVESQSNPVLPSGSNGAKTVTYGEVNTQINFDDTHPEKITLDVDGSQKMNIQDNGNIGIGTVSPTSTLNVVGSTSSYIPGIAGTQIISGAMEFAKSTYPYIDFNGWTLNSDYDSRIILYNENLLSFLGAPIGINYTTYNSNYRLSVGGNSYLNGNAYVTGNLGIGTTSPQEKLHILDGKINLSTTNAYDSKIVLDPAGVFGEAGYSESIYTKTGSLTFKSGDTTSSYAHLNGCSIHCQNNDNSKYTSVFPSGITGYNYNISSSVAIFHVTDSGEASFQSLIIGKSFTYPYNPKAKITSDGKIWAQEVVVQASDPWPDFVFNNDYKSMPLGELENFVKTNNHLPNVPSACDVAENGVNLTKMDAALLQKIEELTLYIIELKKEIDTIKNEKP